jgi:hypothetical protein
MKKGDRDCIMLVFLIINARLNDWLSVTKLMCRSSYQIRLEFYIRMTLEDVYARPIGTRELVTRTEGAFSQMKQNWDQLLRVITSVLIKYESTCKQADDI